MNFVSIDRNTKEFQRLNQSFDKLTPEKNLNNIKNLSFRYNGISGFLIPENLQILYNIYVDLGGQDFSSLPQNLKDVSNFFISIIRGFVSTIEIGIVKAPIKTIVEIKEDPTDYAEEFSKLNLTIPNKIVVYKNNNPTIIDSTSENTTGDLSRFQYCPFHSHSFNFAKPSKFNGIYGYILSNGDVYDLCYLQDIPKDEIYKDIKDFDKAFREKNILGLISTFTESLNSKLENLNVNNSLKETFLIKIKNLETLLYNEIKDFRFLEQINEIFNRISDIRDKDENTISLLVSPPSFNFSGEGTNFFNRVSRFLEKFTNFFQTRHVIYFNTLAEEIYSQVFQVKNVVLTADNYLYPLILPEIESELKRKQKDFEDFEYFRENIRQINIYYFFQNLGEEEIYGKKLNNLIPDFFNLKTFSQFKTELLLFLEKESLKKVKEFLVKRKADFELIQIIDQGEEPLDDLIEYFREQKDS